MRHVKSPDWAALRGVSTTIRAPDVSHYARLGRLGDAVFGRFDLTRAQRLRTLGRNIDVRRAAAEPLHVSSSSNQERDMADTTTAPGQQRAHQVRDTDGNVRTMTQQEWRERDKSAGLVRVDEQGTDLPDDDDEPTTPPA